MSLPASFLPKAGKQNLMSSFNQFLVEQLEGGQVHDGLSTTLPAGKTFWCLFGYPLTGLVFPSISVTEVGLFSRGELALDRVLGHDAVGKPVKGTRNQTLIEVNCWAKDTPESAQAEKTVRELRDTVIYALTNAGEVDESTGLLVVPAITLRDFGQAGEPMVGTITVDRTDNAINEKFIVDAADQNIKRYRLLIRVFWNELT